MFKVIDWFIGVDYRGGTESAAIDLIIVLHCLTGPWLHLVVHIIPT